MTDVAQTLRRLLCLRSTRHLRYVVWSTTALSLALCLLSLHLLESHSTDGATKKRSKDLRGHQYIRKLAELRASAQHPFLASDKENQLWWKSKNANTSRGNHYEDYAVQPVVMLESNKEDYVDYAIGEKFLYTYDHSVEDYPEEISMEGIDRTSFIHQEVKREGVGSFKRISSHKISASKYKHNLYVEAIGPGLGEQMFQYAALYGVSRLNRRIPVATGNFSIWGIFRGSTMLKGTEIPSNVTVLMEAAPGIFTEKLTTLPDVAVQLCCYFHSYKYWSEYKRSVSRQFRFHKDILANASALLLDYGARQLARNNAQDKDVLYDMYGKYPPQRTSQFNYVAVHIHVGDLLRTSQKRKGHRVAPPSYIHQGMQFYRKEYKNSLFIIFTSEEDRRWCRKHLNTTDGDVLLADSTSQSLLLATSTLCNNTLITVGPLSWWVGWLNKGKTIYYTDWLELFSEMDGAYNSKDYFPTEWIGYGN